MTGKKQRQRELAVIHIGKKELGWDKSTYRDTLEAWTGKRSSAKMTESERHRVIENMKKLGFEPKPSAERVQVSPDDDPQVQKIKRIWLELYDAGVVRDPSLASLNAWVRRQTRNEHVAFLDVEDVNTIIESLKQWAGRTGVKLSGRKPGRS